MRLLEHTIDSPSPLCRRSIRPAKSNPQGEISDHKNTYFYPKKGVYYEYTPFGGTVLASGGSLGASGEENPFTFSTKYHDPETSFYYYGFRYYNAENGRWLNRDPIGERGGLNVYAFVENDGINNLDMLGHFSFGKFARGTAKLLSGAATLAAGAVGVAGVSAMSSGAVDMMSATGMLPGDMSIPSTPLSLVDYAIEVNTGGDGFISEENEVAVEVVEGLVSIVSPPSLVTGVLVLEDIVRKGLENDCP